MPMDLENHSISDYESNSSQMLSLRLAKPYVGKIQLQTDIKK